MFRHLFLIFVAAVLSYSKAGAQFFVFQTRVPIGGGITHGKIVYTSKSMSNLGREGLSVWPTNNLSSELDKDGLISRITSDTTVVLVAPSEEEWTKEDPNAFSMTFQNVDGSIFRKTTICYITVDSSPRFVTRSIYLGETMNDYGTVIKKGDIFRCEMASPAKGVGVLTTGTEVGGAFIGRSRNTRINYREENAHIISRLIDEKRKGSNEKWQTVSDILTEMKRFDSEFKKIRVVEFPDGESRTETWDYFTHGQISGSDGHVSDGSMIRTHKEHDGTKTTYQYPKDGKIEEIRTPGEPVRRTTESYVHDPSSRTTVHEEDDRETLRVTKSFPSRTQVITITKRAGEDEQTRVEECYPYGKMFGGQPRRIIEPDGTISTYEYTELPDGSVRTVMENGIGDGERVVAGTRTTTTRTGRGNVLEKKSEPIPAKGEK